MKATDTYQEGYISINSGYFWSGIIYNISVTISLYSLGLFWVCMHYDLKPFRPVPKFLCIKLVIFASYWQGFFLSILVWLGAIPDDVDGYTSDNLAAAIQDALICVEMPVFAIAHWHAFSSTDYADTRVTQGRMPIYYALRDAFGVIDLIQDSRETFLGDKYQYRAFDSGDKVMAHEASRQRLARLEEGMRYERGGKGKYWIPKPGEASSTTPLLRTNGVSSHSDVYGDTLGQCCLDPGEEALYEDARTLEFGDWNVSVFRIHFGNVESNNSQYPVVSTEAVSEHFSAPRRPTYPRARTSTLAVSREAVAQAIAESRGASPAQSPSSAEGSISKKKKRRQKSALKQSAGRGTGSSGSQPTAPQSRVHFTPPSTATVSATPAMEEAHGWRPTRIEHISSIAAPNYVIDDDSDNMGNVWSR